MDLTEQIMAKILSTNDPFDLMLFVAKNTNNPVAAIATLCGCAIQLNKTEYDTDGIAAERLQCMEELKSDKAKEAVEDYEQIAGLKGEVHMLKFMYNQLIDAVKGIETERDTALQKVNELEAECDKYSSEMTRLEGLFRDVADLLMCNNDMGSIEEAISGLRYDKTAMIEDMAWLKRKLDNSKYLKTAKALVTKYLEKWQQQSSEQKVESGDGAGDDGAGGTLPEKQENL